MFIKSKIVLNVVVFPWALDISSCNITLGSQEQILCYIVIDTCFFLTIAVFSLKIFSIKERRKANTGFLVL